MKYFDFLLEINRISIDVDADRDELTLNMKLVSLLVDDD